ncbi:MAG TPA: hypothetical protein VFV34_20090 [Blastocatellia bacterium]|nr:hypothetical protein [Blastocatellia bacterium]
MKIMVRAVAITLAASCLLFGSVAIHAQRQTQSGDSRPVAKRTDIYCTGFISELPPRADLELVGAEKENIKSVFSQGDIVYLNQGRQSGLYPGAVYYVVRPIGKFHHPFKNKLLGYYVRELGMVRVLEVHDHTSTAEVTVSCDMMTFGDLLKPFETVPAPPAPNSGPLPRYGEGTGGTTGQIVLSPLFHEWLGANQIVYLDLGNRQGIRPGDQFTIFRSINRREGVVHYRDDDLAIKRTTGYESDRYEGGELPFEPTVQIPDVVGRRPTLPRKVLGELVVLKVENNACVAIITRSVAEINIGDWVERAN